MIFIVCNNVFFLDKETLCIVLNRAYKAAVFAASVSGLLCLQDNFRLLTYNVAYKANRAQTTYLLLYDGIYTCLFFLPSPLFGVKSSACVNAYPDKKHSFILIEGILTG